MTDALELDALWDEFHRVVNMTSQELAAWLRVQDTAEETEPEQPGSPTGERVLGILQKRRTDLTDDDISTMYEVVDTVTAQQDRESEPEAADTRRLMTLGHDPLRPPRTSAG